MNKILLKIQVPRITCDNIKMAVKAVYEISKKHEKGMTYIDFELDYDRIS